VSYIPSFATLYDHLEHDNLDDILAGLDHVRPQSASAAILADVLRVAAHVLRDNPSHLAGQLLGRLSPDADPDLMHLLDAARGWRGAPWLRPLYPTLTAPGTALLRTILPVSRKASYSRAIALSADGRALLTGTWPGVVRWDVITGRQLATFTDYAGVIQELCVTPDGSLMTTLDTSGTVQVWDIPSATVRVTLKVYVTGGSTPRHTLAPDGQVLLVGTDDGQLTLYATTDGRVLRRFSEHPDIPNFDAYLRRWHNRSPDNPVSAPPSYTSFDFTPDGQYVFAATIQGTLCLWDVARGTIIRRWEGSPRFTTAVAVFPDGQRAVAGATDSSLTLWHLPTGALLAQVSACTTPTDTLFPREAQGWVSAVALSGDGHTVVTCADEPTVRVWNIVDDRMVLRGILPGHRAYSATLDYAGTRLVTFAEDRTIKAWDLTRVSTDMTAESVPSIVRAAVIGERWCATVPDATATRLNLFSPDTPDDIIYLDQHRSPILALARSANGHWLASGDMGGMVRLWMTADGTLSATLRTSQPVFGLVISDDGGMLLSWSEGATITVRDMRRRRRRHAIEYVGDYIYAADISADGQVVVALIDGYLLCAWEQTGRSDPRILEYYDDAVSRLRLRPDGQVALVGTDSGNLLVWNTTTGTIVQTLHGHRRLVSDIAITSDGRRALSVSDDGTALLWDLIEGRIIAGFTTDTALLSGAVSADGRQCVLVDTAGQCHRLQLEGAA
jgi:WD40 repeat protein